MKPDITRPDERPNHGPLSTRTSRGALPVTGLRRVRHSMLTAVAGIVFAVLASAGPVSAKQLAMSNATLPTAKLTTVSKFPVGSFLENLVVRADGSMLVTELNKKALWYVPPPTAGKQVQPVLLDTFDQPPFDIVETKRNVFYVDTTNYLTNHESHEERVDLRHWKPGMPVPVQSVFTFPATVGAPNGSTALSPNVILVDDALRGLIWRVDLSSQGTKATARVWLKDDSMAPNLSSGLVQPGINGVEYDTKTHYAFYTSTAQQLFMRVRVDPRTLNPAGAPELVASGRLWDDFEIDQKAGVAYITTHRQNTIERVGLDPHSGQGVRTVAGNPLNTQLAGPSDFAWGRGPKDYGRVAYVSTDGGFTQPPPGEVPGPARILRANLCKGH
jgi:hypothetical protein